jgi:hypothetical protein
VTTGTRLTKHELVINLKTAMVLGIACQSMPGGADEVIE